MGSAGTALPDFFAPVGTVPGCQLEIVLRSASSSQGRSLPGVAAVLPSSARKAWRGIERNPMSRMVGVGHLPSLRRKPHLASCQLSAVKPIFDVLGSRENCDSVKK